MNNKNDKKVSNENDKEPSWKELLKQLIIRLPEILNATAAFIKAIGASARARTIVIAIISSVAISTVTIVYVPQVQEAIRGPQGLQGIQGIQGIQGETGSPGISEVTQAELDELAIRIDELGKYIDYMGAELDDHLSKIENIRRMINEESGNRLERDESILQVISDLKTFSTPDYDSGWITIDTSKVICTLEDPNVFVYMIGKSRVGSVNQMYYGGYNRHPPYTVEMKMLGAYWFITESGELRVYRYPEDTSYVEVRVLIWQLRARASASGYILYNDEPVTQYTDVMLEFFVRDEDTGMGVHLYSFTYNNVDGYYEIFDLPPGRYGVQVYIDAAEPYNTDRGFPDDYYGWKSPIIINEGDITVTQDLVVSKVIHLTSPVDNIEEIGHLGDEKNMYDGSPLFTWDLITEASWYSFDIQIYREEPFGYLGQAYSTTTSLTSLQPELPLNEENELYLCRLYAYNEAETLVGRLMVSYDNGYGWDYRFKIVMRAQP